VKKKESIFQLLTQKPWDPTQMKVDNLHKGATLDLSKGKLGLRYIMVISTIFFCLFIVTYSDRLIYPDWQKMPEPLMLWLNTFILFISSIVFLNAQIAAKNSQFEIVKKRLIVIGVLALAFLIGQLFVWLQFISLGYYVSSNPANAYFYVFTACIPTKEAPKTAVANINIAHFLRFFSYPYLTASAIVPLLDIRINVIIAINKSGTLT